MATDDLTEIKIAPGIITTKTDRAAAGRYKNGNRVRFFNGNPQKLGGWQKASTNTFLGMCRGAIDWLTLLAEHFIGFGTHLKLYVYKGGVYYDVTPLRASGTLALNPITTALNSTTVTIKHTAHGVTTGDYVHFSGALAVGGITVSGTYNATLVDADNYTIQAASQANANATGGGAAVAYEYELNIGAATSSFGFGWGAGNFSQSTYGTPRSVSNFLQRARTWKLDSWGEDLVANYRGGAIYLWDASVGVATRAAIISQAPQTARGIFVSAENRILVAYGAYNADTSANDPLLIRWCDSEDYTVWTPDVINNVAGSKRLDKGTEILGHAKTRTGTIIQTDTFAWLMTFDGPPNTFGFLELGSNGNLVGPHAMVEAVGRVFWMAKRQFYMYDGAIKVLPCEVWPSVFENFNYVQRDKVFAGVNLTFSEVWWIYPSANSSECDLYVLYNYVEQTWAIGSLSRTCFIGNSQVFAQPYGFGTNGYLYDHEVGNDDDGSPLGDYLESGDVEIGQGDWMMRIRKYVPDFKELVGTVAVTVKARKYPAEAQQTKGPINVTSSTRYINPHLRGRQMSLYIASSGLGSYWQGGTQRVQLRPSGRR